MEHLWRPRVWKRVCYRFGRVMLATVVLVVKMRARRIMLALTVVAVLMSLAACSPPEKSASDKPTTIPKPQIVTVKVTKDGFEPREVKIKARGRVVWVNEDKKPHNIYFDFDDTTSGNVPPKQRVSHTFNKIGVFTYHDPLNPKKDGFKGTVTVY